MEIHQKISQLSKIEHNGEENRRSQRGVERGKIFVTSGNKKASVRKETDAVSVTKSKIVPKNQNTLPPRLLSQPYHEVEVCRRKEVSEAKVAMGPFFDNRADIIWEVLVRERLVKFGIRPSAKSTKQKRVVNAEKSVCSRTKRLMSNQTKSQRKGLLFPHKKRKRRQECCGYCENCTTIGLRLARLGCVGSSKRKTAPVKPDEKKSWDRFERYGSLSPR